MKTLYININNTPISPSDELIVMDYDLMGDFFFYLGERIAKGCSVQNENALITDFNTSYNKQDYDAILFQCDEIKRLLFGENVSGTFNFELPSGYLHWLRYNEGYNHVYDKNFSNGGGGSITIDLEELYDDSIESLQRKIMRKLQRDDLYLDIDEIVFSDESVTRKSIIVRAIKAKYESIGFKAYKKWLQEIGDKAIMAPQVGERSKNNPNECIKSELADDFFPYNGIVLGKTLMKKFDVDINEYTHTCIYTLNGVNFVGAINGNFFLASLCESKLPKKWSSLLGCGFGTSQKKCLSSLNEKKYEIIFKDKAQLVAVSPNKKYRTHLIFDEYETAPKFGVFIITLNECPYCKSNNLSLRQYGQEEGFYLSYCSDCNKFYLPEYYENDESEEIDDNEIPCCPDCGSDDVEDDGSDYLQYTCNECGHNWGHDDTVECPECGSNDIENDGTDNLQYQCNECGNVWGEDEVNDNEEGEEYDDDTDNVGNQLSEYYEAFGFIVGKSTKNDIQRHGGVLVNPDNGYGEYHMPNGIRVYFFNNSQTVKHITIPLEAKNSIPYFYKKIGIYWGINKIEFRNIFENLGFKVVEYKSEYTDQISAYKDYKNCAKLCKCIEVSIHYWHLGMFSFDVS